MNITHEILKPQLDNINSQNVQSNQNYNLQTYIPNVDVQIGDVHFLPQKCHNKTHLEHLLRQFYSKKRSQVQRTSQPSSGNINQPEEIKLTLQDVKFYHYHAVVSTDQVRFTLSKTQFRGNQGMNNSFFNIDMLYKIRFDNLKILSLSAQKLCSVESLCSMDMPCLQRLEIHQNKIVSLNSLSKAAWKNLDYLSLYSNPIVQNSEIYRAKLPKQCRLIIDSDGLQSHFRSQMRLKPQTCTMPDLAWIFKSEGLFGLREVKLNKRQRIFPKEFQETLKSINPQIKLKRRPKNVDLMNRLEMLAQVGRGENNPQRFQRFMVGEVQPILQNRLRLNPNHFEAINQIRLGLQQRLHHMQQLRQQARRRRNEERLDAEIENQYALIDFEFQPLIMQIPDEPLHQGQMVDDIAYQRESGEMDLQGKEKKEVMEVQEEKLEEKLMMDEVQEIEPSQMRIPHDVSAHISSSQMPKKKEIPSFSNEVLNIDAENNYMSQNKNSLKSFDDEKQKEENDDKM